MLKDSDVKKYIKQKGSACPFCKDRAIEGSSVDIDDGMACQEMWCLVCDKRWVDVYKLVGVNEIEEDSER